MKKNNVQKGIFTALLLASPFVTAGTQYPASDFQPKVVYQDKDYQHQGSSSSSSKSGASTGEKARADANYPAATFEPEIVYIDKSYKHNKGASTNKSIPLAMWDNKVDEQIEEKYADEVGATDESSMNPLFAVLVLAVAGFLYFKKTKSGGSTKPKGRRVVNAAPRAKYTGGLTGVARYLEEKSPTLSGVAKYLEANQATPKSGVAKYVAKKVVEAKKAASEKTTGVEKYLRNKG